MRIQQAINHKMSISNGHSIPKLQHIFLAEYQNPRANESSFRSFVWRVKRRTIEIDAIKKRK